MIGFLKWKRYHARKVNIASSACAAMAHPHLLARGRLAERAAERLVDKTADRSRIRLRRAAASSHMRPSTDPRNVFTSSRRAPARSRTRIAPRDSSTPRNRSSSSALLRRSVASGPANRAECTPGAPPSASTSRPESSANRYPSTCGAVIQSLLARAFLRTCRPVSSGAGSATAADLEIRRGQLKFAQLAGIRRARNKRSRRFELPLHRDQFFDSAAAPAPAARPAARRRKPSFPPSPATRRTGPSRSSPRSCRLRPANPPDSRDRASPRRPPCRRWWRRRNRASAISSARRISPVAAAPSTSRCRRP